MKKTKQYKSAIDTSKNIDKSPLDCIVSGTRKRNKKVVFDPSDNNLPKRRKSSSSKLNLWKVCLTKQKKISKTELKAEKKTQKTDEEQGEINTTSGVCFICRLQKNDIFISCSDCSNKAHHGCLQERQGDVGMLRLRPDNTWQCPHCKICANCEETAESGTLTVCKICSDAYHSKCHSPRIKDKSSGSPKWICCKCQSSTSECSSSSTNTTLEIEDIETIGIIKKHSSDSESTKINKMKSDKHISFDNGDVQIFEYEPETANPLSDDPPIVNENNDNSENNLIYSDEFGYLIHPLIPDAREWTSDDVYEYFAQFFPEEAVIFKDEEIDGLALLLMTRDNVVHDLKLKMGTALKMYRHVVLLRERRENPKCYFL